MGGVQHNFMENSQDKGDRSRALSLERVRSLQRKGQEVTVERGKPGSGVLDDGWAIVEIYKESHKARVMKPKSPGSESVYEQTVSIDDLVRLNPPI